MCDPEQSNLLSEDDRLYAIDMLNNLPDCMKRDLERPTYFENNEIGEIDYGWFERNPFKRMMIRRAARKMSKNGKGNLSPDAAC